MYIVKIFYPYRSPDYSSADTLAEARRIAKSEEKRNPQVTTSINKV